VNISSLNNDTEIFKFNSISSDTENLKFSSVYKINLKQQKSVSVKTKGGVATTLWEDHWFEG